MSFNKSGNDDRLSELIINSDVMAAKVCQYLVKHACMKNSAILHGNGIGL
jgi:hypothetical protein